MTQDTSAWDRLPTIEGSRILLRWLEERDTPRLFDIFSNSEVTRFWSWPAWQDPAQARAQLASIHAHFAARTLFQWGVVLRERDLVIGTCTLNHLDFSNGRAELGFALHREFWGSGLMKEATSTLIDYAFDEMGLRRLEADVDPRNARSVSLLDRLGFVREGLMRERWHVDGEIQDALFCGLLARERPWLAERVSPSES